MLQQSPNSGTGLFKIPHNKYFYFWVGSILMVTVLGIGIGVLISSNIIGSKIGFQNNRQNVAVGQLPAQNMEEKSETSGLSECNSYKELQNSFSATPDGKGMWYLRENDEPSTFDYHGNFAMRDFVGGWVTPTQQELSFACPTKIERVRNENRYIFRWASALALFDFDRMRIDALVTLPDKFPLNQVVNISFHPTGDIFLIETAWEGGPWLEYVVDFSGIGKDNSWVKVLPIPMTTPLVVFDKWTADGVEMKSVITTSLEYLGDVTSQQCQDYITDDLDIDVATEKKLAESRTMSTYDIGGVSCDVCSAMYGHGCYGVVREYRFAYEPSYDFIKLISDKSWSGNKK